MTSGHTHRRGLYFISGVGRSLDGSGRRETIRTRYFDFTDFPQAARDIGPERRIPTIVVSDSSGPIPRHNARGEFFGWGSSAPSGTGLVFRLDSLVPDTDGELKFVTTVPASTKPRLAIPLDYMDIVERKEVIPALITDAFDPDDENRGRLQRYTFRLRLHPQLNVLRIRFAAIRLLVNDSGVHFEAIDLVRRTDTEWEIAGSAQMRLFRRMVAGANPLGRFVSVKLTTDNQDLLGRYDVASAWNFEFNLDIQHISNSGIPIIGPLIDLLAGTKKRYALRRYVNVNGNIVATPHPRCERPDFAFRSRFRKYLTSDPR